MKYSEATAFNKLRAISAYCGNFVWDCLSEDDQTKWFLHEFTAEDAIRVLVEWEKGMDEQEKDNWRGFIETEYQDYLNGRTDCDGRV